jgi:hypothetical protein
LGTIKKKDIWENGGEAGRQAARGVQKNADASETGQKLRILCGKRIYGRLCVG